MEIDSNFPRFAACEQSASICPLDMPTAIIRFCASGLQSSTACRLPGGIARQKVHPIEMIQARHDAPPKRVRFHERSPMAARSTDGAIAQRTALLELQPSGFSMRFLN